MQHDDTAIDVRGGDQIHLVRDVLDEQLVDHRQQPMGRVDGVVLCLPDGQAPQVVCVQSGITIAAGRVGRWAGRCARWVARRWGLSRGRPVRIGWNHLVRLGLEAKLDLYADQTAALAWEHWLFTHIVRHVPSLKPAEKREGQAKHGPVPPAPHMPRVRGRRVRLERLLGRKVIDVNGKNAGKIEEVRAHVRDGVCVVESFELGRQGLLERLSISDLSLAMVRVLGARRGTGAKGHRVPWQQMDVSDPKHPRLRCAKEELLGEN